MRAGEGWRRRTHELESPGGGLPRSPHHCAGPGPHRLSALRGSGIRGPGRLRPQGGEPSGGQRRGPRGAGDDRSWSQPEDPGRYLDRRYRRRPGTLLGWRAPPAMAGRPGREGVGLGLHRPARRLPLLPGGRRWHRRPDGHGQPLHLPPGFHRRTPGEGPGGRGRPVLRSRVRRCGAQAARSLDGSLLWAAAADEGRSGAAERRLHGGGGLCVSGLRLLDLRGLRQDGIQARRAPYRALGRARHRIGRDAPGRGPGTGGRPAHRAAGGPRVPRGATPRSPPSSAPTWTIWPR